MWRLESGHGVKKDEVVPVLNKLSTTLLRPAFFYLGASWKGECSASRPGRFTHGEIAPVTI
jgi:hypothetical protein